MKFSWSIFCFGIGVICLVLAGIISINYLNEDSEAEKDVEEVLEQVIDEIAKEVKVELPEDIVDRNMPTVEVDGYRYIGTLNVKEFELVLPVMENWDEERLKKSPCRYAGSFYEDNLVIAGHNYNKHFRLIKSISSGSEITFSDVEGNDYKYYVAWIETILPNDIDKMIQKSEQENWDLTLFTCSAGGGRRLAVRCIRIE